MLAYAKWLAYFSFLPTLQPSEKVCWNKICLEYNSCHKRSRLRSRHFSCCTLHFQVGIDGKSLRLNYVRYTASLKLKNGPHYATIVPLRKSMRTMEENAACSFCMKDSISIKIRRMLIRLNYVFCTSQIVLSDLEQSRVLLINKPYTQDVLSTVILWVT